MTLSSPTRRESQLCDNDSNAAEAHTRSLRNALSACALPLWLTALMSVPYLFNFRTYATLPHSPLPLLIALGMIVAAAALPSIAKRTTPSTLILVRKACLIGGAVSLALASLILARAPYRLSLSLYTMQFDLFGLFFMIEKVLNVASKPLWFSSGFCMAIALIIPCDLKSEADAQEAHASNVPATLWLTLPLVCLAGFLLERTWGTLSFPAYDDPFVARPWWTYASRSGTENLELLASINNRIGSEQIEQVIAMVGLDPHDRRPFKKYSLGMKQRLGIAAAIMESPDIVLLDEPTNALDSSGVTMVKRVVAAQRARGATVVLTCHDRKILYELADEVYAMAEGRIQSHMTLKEAIKDANRA